MATALPYPLEMQYMLNGQNAGKMMGKRWGMISRNDGAIGYDEHIDRDHKRKTRWSIPECIFDV